jgi:hypothetical protein
MTRPKVLLVASSSSQGWYLVSESYLCQSSSCILTFVCWQPELAHPYTILEPYCDLTLASPNGGATVCDPVSVELFKNDEVCVDFKNTKESLWMNTEKLDAFSGRATEFDSIFIIGGFGRRSSSTSPTLSLQHSSTLYLPFTY